MGSPATGTLIGSVSTAFFSLHVALVWLIITFCIRVGRDAILDQGTKYRICSHNLRTFFSILAAEKSGSVKYADLFLWRS